MQVEKFNVILSHRATMMLANHVRFLAQKNACCEKVFVNLSG